jgi:hypothetical protein
MSNLPRSLANGYVHLGTGIALLQPRAKNRFSAQATWDFLRAGLEVS